MLDFLSFRCHHLIEMEKSTVFQLGTQFFPKTTHFLTATAKICKKKIFMASFQKTMLRFCMSM